MMPTVPPKGTSAIVPIVNPNKYAKGHLEKQKGGDQHRRHADAVDELSNKVVLKAKPKGSGKRAAGCHWVAT